MNCLLVLKINNLLTVARYLVLLIVVVDDLLLPCRGRVGLKTDGTDDTADRGGPTNYRNELSIHRASPVWFVHWLAIHMASPVPIYPIWLYTGLDRTYYSSVFL